MLRVLRLWVGVTIRVFRSRRSLLIENLALRQQLAVYKRRNSRPRLAALDKLFWVLLRRYWSSWKAALIVVSPDYGRALASLWLPTVLAAHLACA